MCFITSFEFLEEDNHLENISYLKNETKITFDSNKSISFGTSKNLEQDITDYYNLIYEYENDCLTAGIRFNKTYYEDRDLKPSEKLMFTINFYPLTSIEQSVK